MESGEGPWYEYRVKFKFPWGVKGYLVGNSRTGATREANELLDKGADITILRTDLNRGRFSQITTRSETSATWKARQKGA